MGLLPAIHSRINPSLPRGPCARPPSPVPPPSPGAGGWGAGWLLDRLGFRVAMAEVLPTEVLSVPRLFILQGCTCSPPDPQAFQNIPPRPERPWALRTWHIQDVCPACEATRTCRVSFGCSPPPGLVGCRGPMPTGDGAGAHHAGSSELPGGAAFPWKWPGPNAGFGFETGGCFGSRPVPDAVSRLMVLSVSPAHMPPPGRLHLRGPVLSGPALVTRARTAKPPSWRPVPAPATPRPCPDLASKAPPAPGPQGPPPPLSCLHPVQPGR